MMHLQPADIVLTASRGWLGGLIRRAERSPGEPKSVASHAALVVAEGPWDSALVSEAVGRGVLIRTLHPTARSGALVKILRPLNIPARELDRIVGRAYSASDSGVRYGFGQLLLHGGDALLSWARGREVVLFRKAIDSRKFTTCARHVAFAYRAAGYDFGVPADLCTPDHIDDWASAHPALYTVVMPWGTLTA